MTVPRPLPCLCLTWSMIVVALVGLGGLAPARAQDEGSSPSSSDRGPAPQAIPLPIYFPPNPPPLGRLVSHLSSSSNGQTFAPPPELAAYVTEPFYPPLSTQLAQHALEGKKRAKLDAYRVARDRLLEELMAELSHVRETDPATRRTVLADLAQRQSARLVELEATAEQLRGELVTGANNWSALRDWHLGERNRRGDSPVELGAVMRAYAYYQPGLLPEQRQLLRETVIELTNGAEDATTASAQQPYLFFSPALSRVRLPDHLPAATAAKIAVYETKKSSLKKELFDLVSAEDNAVFPFTRNAAIRAVAARQAAPLAELERLADEIRDGLVDVPLAPAHETRSPLPPGLTQRTMEAVQARTALLKSSRAKLDAVLGELPENYPVAFATTLDANGVKVRFIRRGRRVWPNDPVITGTVARLNEIGEEHRLRNVELNREIEALRDDVARALGPNSTPEAVTEALDAVIRYNVQRENEDGYADYRTAVFEPGLSPEQRRLLIGGAVRKLDLRLPGGELQPMQRPATW